MGGSRFVRLFCCAVSKDALSYITPPNLLFFGIKVLGWRGEEFNEISNLQRSMHVSVVTTT